MEILTQALVTLSTAILTSYTDLKCVSIAPMTHLPHHPVSPGLPTANSTLSFTKAPTSTIQPDHSHDHYALPARQSLTHAPHVYLGLVGIGGLVFAKSGAAAERMGGGTNFLSVRSKRAPSVGCRALCLKRRNTAILMG